MVTMPAMMGDLVKRMAMGRVRLDIIAELEDRGALVRRIAPLRPDLVVIGVDRPDLEKDLRALLRRRPTCRIIAVGPGGRMTGYDLRVRRSELSDLSPDELIAFIRAPVDGAIEPK
jgi:hypothetical protein